MPVWSIQSRSLELELSESVSLAEHPETRRRVAAFFEARRNR